MGSQTFTFEVGVRVIYAGSNDRIGNGTCGTVITRPSITPCTIGVKYDGKEEKLSSLGNIDDSFSSLWCDPKNLQPCDEGWLNEARSTCFDLDGLL